MATQNDLIETALRARKFSTLSTALTAAGVIETLKSEGPFTVFAPTDDAFSTIPIEVLNELLEPENRDTLTSILTYHVVRGRLTADEVASLESVTTVQGQKLRIDRNNRLKINGAAVVTPDIKASNGIIHIIDAVLIPTSSASV